MIAQWITRCIVNSTLSKFLNDKSQYLEFTMCCSNPNREQIHVKEKLDFVGGYMLEAKLQNFATQGVYYNKYTRKVYVLTNEEAEDYQKILHLFSKRWKDNLVQNYDKIIKSIRTRTDMLMTIITLCALCLVWASSLAHGNVDSVHRLFVFGITIIIGIIYMFTVSRMSKQLDAYLNELLKKELR